MSQLQATGWDRMPWLPGEATTGVICWPKLGQRACRGNTVVWRLRRGRPLALRLLSFSRSHNNIDLQCWRKNTAQVTHNIIKPQQFRLHGCGRMVLNRWVSACCDQTLTNTHATLILKSVDDSFYGLVLYYAFSWFVAFSNSKLTSQKTLIV